MNYIFHTMHRVFWMRIIQSESNWTVNQFFFERSAGNRRYVILRDRRAQKWESRYRSQPITIRIPGSAWFTTGFTKANGRWTDCGSNYRLGNPVDIRSIYILYIYTYIYVCQITYKVDQTHRRVWIRLNDDLSLRTPENSKMLAN